MFYSLHEKSPEPGAKIYYITDYLNPDREFRVARLELIMRVFKDGYPVNIDLTMEDLYEGLDLVELDKDEYLVPDKLFYDVDYNLRIMYMSQVEDLLPNFRWSYFGSESPYYYREVNHV